MKFNVNRNTTFGGNLDSLKDSDDATSLMVEYEESNPEDGIFTKYWSNGNRRYEWEYKDGKRVDGESKGWYPNGQLNQVRNWKDGRVDGKYTEWFEDGQKMVEGTFKDGKQHGLIIQWYDNGKKQSETNYINGAAYVNNVWDENGNITVKDGNGLRITNEFKGTYKDGKQDGLWTIWHDNGQKQEETIYDDGEHIYRKCWDKDGELISQEYWNDTCWDTESSNHDVYVEMDINK